MNLKEFSLIPFWWHCFPLFSSYSSYQMPYYWFSIVSNKTAILQMLSKIIVRYQATQVLLFMPHFRYMSITISQWIKTKSKNLYKKTVTVSQYKLCLKQNKITSTKCYKCFKETSQNFTTDKFFKITLIQYIIKITNYNQIYHQQAYTNIITI